MKRTESLKYPGWLTLGIWISLIISLITPDSYLARATDRLPTRHHPSIRLLLAREMSTSGSRELPPSSPSQVFAPASDKAIIQKYATLLEKESNPDIMEAAASALAASSLPLAHKTLTGFLKSGKFLSRLDSADRYTLTYSRLRLANIINTLEKNRCASARTLIVNLIASKTFQAHVLRIQLLIHALAVIIPSTPKIIAYWDKFSQAQSPLIYDVVESILTNQSPPALKLLKTKIDDHHFDIHDKIDWFRQLVLPRRNDLPLLLFSEKILKENASSQLKTAIIEVLFDYKPEKWYIDDPPQPPPLESISKPSQAVLVRIGHRALNAMNLDQSIRRNIKRKLQVISE